MVEIKVKDIDISSNHSKWRYRDSNLIGFDSTVSPQNNSANKVMRC